MNAAALGDVKFCKDCKWFVPIKMGWWDRLRGLNDADTAKCGRTFDLVTGAADESCRQERLHNFASRCGPGGRFWEAKDSAKA